MLKYQTYMMKFTQPKLKYYLGDKMVETLIEWSPNSETLLTKSRLISMIDCLRGKSIFKEREFRKDLLLTMNPKDILNIRDNCLSATEKTENDPIKLIDIIAKKTWGKNKISYFLLNMWGVTEDIFATESVETNVISTVGMCSDRFYELLDYQY